MKLPLDPAFSAPARTAPPYPYHRVEHWQAGDGTVVTVRPIRAVDVGLEAAFLANLSPEARYQRVLSMRHLLPGELRRLTDIDYRREMALIATVWTAAGERQVGVARYVREPGGSADFAIVVDDRWQRRGLGEKLLRSLRADAADEGVTALTGITLSTNVAMFQLARKLGFTLKRDPRDATVTNLRLSL
jgi:acetyltransferase